MLSNLVRHKAKNTGSVTVEEMVLLVTITCCYKSVDAAKVWVCETPPRPWYTRCNNE